MPGKKDDEQNGNQGDGMHAWEEFVVKQVYPEPVQKAKQDYRNYDDPQRDCVREFYRENHKLQTYEFVCQKQQNICH